VNQAQELNSSKFLVANRDGIGVRELNTALQEVLNPTRPGQPAVERFGWRFQIGDKVIQTENDYDKDVFNGDVGIVERIDAVEQQVAVRFDDRLVKYDFGDLDEISLAYAITIHKSQGSEFPAVVIPLATQHLLLQRNLIYTGITRGKRLLVLIGQKKALGIAVRNDRPQRRYSGLLASLGRHQQKEPASNPGNDVTYINGPSRKLVQSCGSDENRFMMSLTGEMGLQ